MMRPVFWESGVLLASALFICALIVLRPYPGEIRATFPKIAAPGGLPLAVPSDPAATPATAPDAQASAAPPQPVRGVDVSHYQGRIDWPSVASAGISFAYAKATEGLTYVDPQFARNATGAPTAGISFGAYHFFRPGDDAVMQAKHFLSTVSVASGDLPPALDLEMAAQSGDPELAGAARRWLEYVETQTGCKPIVYASRDFYQTQLGDALSAYRLYLAEYSREFQRPSGAGPLVLWQHSQHGKVMGVKGLVDLDLFESKSGDFEAFLCP